MRCVVLLVLSSLLSGCGDGGNMNDRAYVITKSQFEEVDPEAPIPALEE